VAIALAHWSGWRSIKPGIGCALDEEPFLSFFFLASFGDTFFPEQSASGLIHPVITFSWYQSSRTESDRAPCPFSNWESLPLFTPFFNPPFSSRMQCFGLEGLNSQGMEVCRASATLKSPRFFFSLFTPTRLFPFRGCPTFAAGFLPYNCLQQTR